MTEVDEPPAGFATAVLVPTTPAPPGAQTGATAPTGSVWYKLAPPTTSGRFSLEWYVHVQHLLPGRAYRVDMTVNGQRIYSVGNGHAGPDGTMTAHGILNRFEDSYCVTTPTLPQPLAGHHALTVGVKSDGAGTGSPSRGDPLTDPGRDYSCDGNGDGDFEYWLGTQAPITLNTVTAGH